MRSLVTAALFTMFLVSTACAQDTPPDPSARVLMVPVENGVTLEVLDWGGTGRPVIFLPGGGETASVFFQLAPKLTGQGHIYGITRRGFGASSAPPPPKFDVILRPDHTFEVSRHDLSEPNPYDANRLGDDVLAVMDKLNLARPVLIGHSLGGEELSSVGSRHPERVAGLIYLDALSNDFSFFTEPEYELPFKKPHASIGTRRLSDVMLAVLTGVRKYPTLPVLGIAAYPRFRTSDPEYRAAADAQERKRLDDLERDIPTARIVRFPYASHYLWHTNEADVLREIRTFLSHHR